jgi:large subunit ribosomal protein L13
MPTLQTKSAQPAAVTNKWIVVDAEGAVVGRLASFIAMRLRGKHRADFTPHVDTGDFVVVVNAEKVAFTGKKLLKKIYYWHTGYPGGIKERAAGKILGGKHPERIIEKAVERMMPKESPLARKQLSKLRVYPGAAHPHEAQAPETIDFKSRNRKNSRIG